MSVPPRRGQSKRSRSKPRPGKVVVIRGSSNERIAATRAMYFLADLSSNKVAMKPAITSNNGMRMFIGLLLDQRSSLERESVTSLNRQIESSVYLLELPGIDGVSKSVCVLSESGAWSLAAQSVNELSYSQIGSFQSDLVGTIF